MLSQQESLEEVASQQNHYVEHLAEVNKSNDVIATQDIYNENGLLVARKGSHINSRTADRIIQHKLLQPLEEQIKLEDSLNSNGLNEGVKSFMDKYPDVMQVHSVCEFQNTLDRLLEGDSIHPILLQEFTVMYERLPEYYEKTLFCAWLSALIAKELGMPEDLIKNTFLAGLARDVGLLHISPDILHRQETLSPEEWRAMQCHVIIGQVMLKKLYGMNSPAAKAVLEHHERCDGSGYPIGKTDEQLDIMGQILGMADSIQTIRVNNFTKCGRNLRDILPYLKMNKYTHFLKVHNAVRSILKKSGLKPSHINPHGDIKALVSHLLVNGKKLQSAVILLDQVLEQTESIEEGSSYKKLVKAVQPMVIMIEASGLVKNELLTWLETLQNKIDETDLDVFLEIEFMQNELYWQLKNVCKVINDYLNKDGGIIAPERKEHLENISGQITRLIKF